MSNFVLTTFAGHYAEKKYEEVFKEFYENKIVIPEIFENLFKENIMFAFLAGYNLASEIETKEPEVIGLPKHLEMEQNMQYDFESLIEDLDNLENDISAMMNAIEEDRELPWDTRDHRNWESMLDTVLAVKKYLNVPAVGA